MRKKVKIEPRGCGFPLPNVAYFTTTVDDMGEPWWTFIHDPIPVIDTIELGLAAQGIRVLPRAIGFDEDGTVFAKDKGDHIIYDMWDFVGQHSHNAGYWNAADFIMEVINMGLHRLNPSTTNFKNIGEEVSTAWCIHKP